MSGKQSGCVELPPARLLCLRCMNGGGRLPFMEKEMLGHKLEILKENRITRVKLITSFDEMGAGTKLLEEQSAAERRRDLDVLRRLGLSPGDTRLSRDLYEIIREKIPRVRDICGCGGAGTSRWPACPLAEKGYYEKGGEGFQKLKGREEMACWKRASCREIEESGQLLIRSHHMLCVVCFIGKPDDPAEYSPLAEDNLYEVWMRMKANPDVPVTLVEGAGECMVCPPCHRYDNEQKLCFAGCHLRDRWKDLETFKRLDVLPGETLPAREIVRRIYRDIPDVEGICYSEEAAGPQWKDCASVKRYKRGLERGFLSPGR